MDSNVDLKVAAPYKVGTLAYSRLGLVTLFIWLLWGDFCFMLMATALPTLLPLSLKNIGASNMIIGIIVGSMPNLINILVNPIISVKSDRFRSRFGRRIPFLLISVPLVALFLILIGYSDVFGEWLKLHNMSSYKISSAGLTLIFICIFATGFQFFNMFVSSIYYYLFPDVIPEQFMGRFCAWFRVVGMIAAFLFYRYLLGFSKTHTKEIYLAIGLLYLVSLLLMCWRVKEGNYPPPQERPKGNGFLGSIKIYLRECFGHPLYRWTFLGTATFMFAIIPLSTFGLFFPRDTLGLSLDEIGKIHSWGMVLLGCLLIPAGYISDKFHPLRIYILGVTVSVIGMSISFFTIHDKSTYFTYNLITTGLYAFFLASVGPMFISLVPKEKYGQFGSAQAIINSLGLIVGSFIAGKFFDLTGNYRFQYIWIAFFGGLSLIPMYFVYREWSRRGGTKRYVAPIVGENCPKAEPIQELN